jgi:hypothetical protein
MSAALPLRLKILNLTVLGETPGVILEKLLAGGRSVQATQDAKLAVVDIGNPRTVVSAVGIGIEGEDVGEESLGELGIEQRALRYNFFRDLTDYGSSIKCLLREIPRERGISQPVVTQNEWASVTARTEPRVNRWGTFFIKSLPHRSMERLPENPLYPGHKVLKTA